jgi:hypothetical protein
MAVCWSAAGLARDVGPTARVAVIGTGISPGTLRLTLHPLGARRTPPGLAGGLWSSEKQLQLDTPLSIGVQYLHLALTGGYRPGWLPFLGTSTATVGGLRIRF